MPQEFRLREILEIARTDGRVKVEALAERFDVTVQTIRRDLAELDEAGKLERVHGGAILRSGSTNIAYRARRALQSGAKRAMARACADAIAENTSVFLNIGTTTEAVAEALRHRSGLMVITNNLNIANIMSSSADIQVIVTGGALRHGDGGLIGNLTESTIRQFKFDLAVIGCSAVDGEGDILDFDIQEVGVSRTIIGQSRRTWLVADHTKLQRMAPVHVASLADIDCLFTDKPLPEALARLCAQWNTQVVVAQHSMCEAGE
ncbi:MAG: DeoR/GlpR transcriptional regulator [Pararhodobacter sp.]|nr:DeoR/GlpR transcriptional regulator [Pararhodobacter sp.]